MNPRPARWLAVPLAAALLAGPADAGFKKLFKKVTKLPEKTAQEVKRVPGNVAQVPDKVAAEAKRVERRVEKGVNRTDENLHDAARSAGKGAERVVREIGRGTEGVVGGFFRLISSGEGASPSDGAAAGDGTLKYDCAPAGRPADADWTVTFRQATLVRLHTGPGYAPYHEATYTPQQSIVLKPGQWLEGSKGGKWVVLGEVDHRAGQGGR